jgi:nucleoside-diphosphate-sugar epimerase
MHDSKLASIIQEDAERVVNSIPDWSPLKGKRVLVTGGTGLIGLHIAATLERLRHAGLVGPVTLVAKNSPTGPASIVCGHADIVCCDLSNAAHISQLPYDQDIIIHAAGYGQPSKFMEKGLKTIELNTATTDALHQHLADNSRFLFLSSSEIYSGNPDPPYGENDCGHTSPLHARSPYIEGKRCGEAICSYHFDKGRHYRVARIALTYGPGTRPDDGRVLNQFIKRALTEKVIRMRDLGTAMRAYCYVSDCVETLFNVILHGKKFVYNVGGHSRTSIQDLAQAIANKTGAVVELPDLAMITDVPNGAPNDVSLDVSRAESEFNKTEYVPLSEGLDRTIAYQQLLYENSSNRS